MFEKWIRRKRIPDCQQGEEMLPDIRIITRWEGTAGDFYAPGALVQVKNGKGRLREAFTEEPADYFLWKCSYLALLEAIQRDQLVGLMGGF